MPYIEIKQKYEEWFKARGIDAQEVANRLLEDCIIAAEAAERREAAEKKADAELEKVKEEHKNKEWKRVEDKPPAPTPPTKPEKKKTPKRGKK